MPTITVSSLRALEILDSRGRPTLSVTATLESGATGTAGVPSGASTGTREAVELRDGDPHRYGGAGVRTAVAHVHDELARALAGRPFGSIAEVDRALRDADGTPNKSWLGANAIVGVSMAVARAIARDRREPLWQTLDPHAPRLPVPHFNVVNGGVHAANDLDFQEFMIAPVGAPSFAEALRAGAEVYGELRRLLAGRGLSVGLGDEGGFAPEISEPEEVLTLLVEAITQAGYTPGRAGVCVALDPAASEFHGPDGYRVAGERLTSSALIDRYEHLIERFPIWSLEDGLAEDDWDGWKELTARLGERVQVVGDDIFVTDPATIREAASRSVGTASLIKLNQIGSVSETLEALQACRDVGFGAMISHRSGETTDSFIADLAVASGCGQLKSGAPARGERLAKYNRLVEIAAANPALPYGLPHHR
ncbi:enolase [Nostocoides japonicum T1-X7]|uniref:Enolase n=1 Tax=Nostocoides japonicum T1-X7 TaxID=1194083 RepID=A0A077LWF0_9MICO|nr:phosphopyruvate hydratase [Tetrasphaera japonica]CCH78051.1 enolase [Tetrasphaera japonica T1-X7]